MDLPLPRTAVDRDAQSDWAQADRRTEPAAASHARLQVALMAGRMGRWDWHVAAGTVE